MRKIKLYLILLYFIVIGTALFAQNGVSEPFLKITVKNGTVVETEPLNSIKQEKGTNFPQKVGYSNAILNLTSVEKINPVTNKKKETTFNDKGAKSIAGWVTILTEDFEGVFPGTNWNVYSGTGYTNAYWEDEMYKAYGGSWGAWCSGAGTGSVIPGLGNYPDNMNAWMEYGPFSLSDANDASLTFMNWNDSEADYDFFRWMVSIDGINYYGMETSGNSGGWVSRSLDFKNINTLGNITGQPNVWLAFVFTSDGSFNYEGSYIDDILLRKNTVTLTPPDLKWTNMALSASAWTVGTNITVDLTEVNIGTGTAGPHLTRLYLSDNTIISAADTQLGSDLSYSSIIAGGSQVQSKAFTVPDIIDGTYYVGAIVDINNTVTESDESNNTDYRSGQVTTIHSTAISVITASVLPVNSGTVTGSGTFSNGTSVSLRATPATGYNFLNWTEGANIISTGATYTFTATGNRTFVANFVVAAPLAKSASNINGSGFYANWNSTVMATGYKLDVSTNIGFTSFVTGYNNKDVGNFTQANVTGLSAKTQYFYRVRAYITGGTSGNSNVIPVTTLSNPSTVPSGLTATSCNNLVSLNWAQSTGPDFVRYRIYGGTSNNPTIRIDSTIIGITNTSKVISGLTKGQTYYFRVTAVNNDGAESNFSNQSITTVKTGVIPRIKTKWNDVLICYNLGDSIRSYQWYKGITPVSGETGQYYKTDKISGVYTVETIDLNGCKNSSTPKTITGTKSLSVYPNPASESFSLKINGQSDGWVVVRILNSSGIKVMEFQTGSADNELLHEIPVDNLQEGIYIVQVLLDSKDLYYTKIVVTK
jgi:hypothetical protein